MKEKLENLRRETYKSDDDVLLVCILSHGAKGSVHGTDLQEVKIEEEICHKFDGSICPKLLGKPKIFIIQACQGGNCLPILHH